MNSNSKLTDYPNVNFLLRKKTIIVLCTLIVFVGIIFDACSGNEKAADNLDSKTDSSAYFAFRNSVTAPPADWKGPRFKLSHNYPTSLPSNGKDMPWLKVPVNFENTHPTFERTWTYYMNSILKYVMNGQDLNLTDSKGFNANPNGKAIWFHVPWMAYDPSTGREFIHGCTSERVASMADIDGDGIRDAVTMANTIATGPNTRTEGRFETWAVGLYNNFGGYAIGQTFPANGKATLINRGGRSLPAGLPFPEGTCVVKLLFTTATETDVPFLKGSPEWIVDRHIPLTDSTFGCDRSPQTVRLIQMDVAVVDFRSPTHWVFGTFAYNGNMTGTTAVDRLVPVGIQFGNDPQSCPAGTEAIPVFQSVLNTKVGIYEHNGCGGRLAGPVDNAMSSCMSCHGAAYTAPMDEIDSMGTNIPSVFGFTTLCTKCNDTNKYYFSNTIYPEPYGDPRFENDIPLDFSLQMWVAFEQYKKFKINHSAGACNSAKVSHDEPGDNKCLCK